MMQIVINNTFSIIKGMDNNTRQKLSNFLTYYITVNKKKIASSFLYANDSFFTGLLSLILDFFKSIRVGYTLMDLRVFPAQDRTDITFTGSDREYQMIETEMLRRGRGIVKGPTGSGKTVVMARFLAKLGLPSLVITNSSDMLYQLKSAFEKFMDLGGKEIGIYGDGTAEFKYITVATIQTLYKRITVPPTYSVRDFESLLSLLKDKEFTLFRQSYKLTKKKETYDDNGIEREKIKETFVLDKYLERRKLKEMFSILCKYGKASMETKNYLANIPSILVDEMHHSAAKTYKEVLLNSDAYFRWGFSATPIREDMDSRILTGLFGRVIEMGEEDKLIEAGNIVKPKVYFIKYASEFYSGAFLDVYKQGIVESEKRNRIISDLLKEFKGRRILVMVKFVSHLEKLMEIIPANDHIVYLSGADKTEYRNIIREKFKEIEYGAIICTSIFREGIDISSLDVLIDARGGKGIVQTTQGRGRVMRAFENKTECIIIDFIDNSYILNKHSYMRVDIYKKAGDEVIFVRNAYEAAHNGEKMPIAGKRIVGERIESKRIAGGIK